MSKVYSIFKNETMINRGWFVGWILGIGFTFLFTALTYPGDEEMVVLLELLQSEEFEPFFGDLGGYDPKYSLWISIMYPLVLMILLIYSVMAGVKIVTQETDKRTGEILFTLPIERRLFYFAKWLSAIFFIFTIVFTLSLLLVLPINGFSLELDKVLKLGLYTLLYSFSGISLGIVIGLLTGRGDNGSQVGLLSVLFLYVLQSIGRIQEELNRLNKLNLLELFIPSEILLEDKINYWSAATLFLIFLVGLLVGLKGFDNRDLIEGSNLSFLKGSRNKESLITHTNTIETKVKLKRTTKSSIFTIWIRPLENRLPVTADFVYSERRVLLIMFWAIVMTYPLQLVLYPGDELALKTIESFGTGGVFKLFTYNHDLTNDPYLWWLITQSVGGHWIFFLPLVFYWVKKITINDAEKGTGEILGSQPLVFKTIVFQRILAILLELILMVILMIFFVFISEMITGQTEGLFWEAVAISMIVPFYTFWTSLLVSIALILRKSGVKIARAIYFGSFILFATAIINENLNSWYFRGIFGLYDPVLLIQEKSIRANNNGSVVIILLAIFTPLLLILSSRYFSWSQYDQEIDAKNVSPDISD